MLDDRPDGRTPAAAGGVLLAAAALYTLTLEGASVPCVGLSNCERTVTFGGLQVVGLVAVAVGGLGFVAIVHREPWSETVAALGGALAAVAGAYVLFAARGTLGTGLFGRFWPAIAAALLASVLLGAAAYLGGRAADLDPP